MSRKATPESKVTQSQILDAAEQLFFTVGPSCSLSRIAFEAGLTRGAIYWHFRNREEVMSGVADRIEVGWENVLEDCRSDASLNPLANLQELAEKMLRKINEEPRLQKMVRCSTRLVACSPDLFARYKALMEFEWSRAASMGLVRKDMHAESATLGLLTMTAGLAKHWAESRHSFDLLLVGHHSVKAYLAGWLDDIPAQKC